MMIETETDYRKCLRYHNYGTFCARGQGKTGICSGDSGGPFVCPKVKYKKKSGMADFRVLFIQFLY